MWTIPPYFKIGVLEGALERTQEGSKNVGPEGPTPSMPTSSCHCMEMLPSYLSRSSRGSPEPGEGRAFLSGGAVWLPRDGEGETGSHSSKTRRHIHG